MNILDRYLLKRYFAYFFGAVIVFLSIFFLVDLVEKIDNFLDYNLSFVQILYYYFYIIPWFIHVSIPMSALIAVVFSLGKLIKFNEFVAMESSGISLYRISVPLLIIGLLTSICAFEFEDRIVVPSHQKLSEFKNEYMTRQFHKKKDKIQRNIYLQLENGSILNISSFNINRGHGKYITIQKIKNGILKERYDAKNIYWQNKKWILTNTQVRKFENSNENFTFNDSLEITLGIKPNDLLQKNIDPENMTFVQLRSFIKKLRNLGINSIKWEVNLFFKTALNFTSFIVILFGISIVTFQTRSGGQGMGIALSLMIIFIYYGTLMFGKLLGIAGQLSPFLSVWLPNFIFLFLGIVFLLGAKK